jgi:type I restriction enzyme S subunit
VSSRSLVQLGTCLSRASTWNPLRESADDVFRYIDLSSVDQDTKSISDAREVACGEAPSRARQLVTAGDVLVSTVRPNLNGVARVPSELDGATASTGFCVLRPEPKKIDGSYLFQWVKSSAFIGDMVSKATGASYPAVSDRIIFESPIPLPPLEEQRRIAAILDQAETLRTQRRQALAHLDTLTQSIFLDMFGDPASNPRGFQRKKLGELIAEGPQNGLYKSSTEYGSGTPILRIDAFYDGVVTKLNSLKRVRLSPDEIKLFGLAAEDIVINRVNSIEYLGKSALIPPLLEPTVFESNMMRFTVRRDQVEPGYVVHFLQTPFIKGQILSGSKNAVNQSSINQQDVKGFQINVPPLALQQTFATRIQAIEALKATHRTALAQLDALFASLQQRAFAGAL